jgi:hypothetical protein
MKQVIVRLNESEFNKLENEAKRLAMPNQSLAKHLILFGLTDDKIAEHLSQLLVTRQKFLKEFKGENVLHDPKG